MKNVLPLYHTIKEEVSKPQLSKDVHSFVNKKNKAAGTRIRVVMQKLKKHAQQLRLLIQEIKNRKTKK